MKSAPSGALASPPFQSGYNHGVHLTTASGSPALMNSPITSTTLLDAV
jgi:hypothetical protein